MFLSPRRRDSRAAVLSHVVTGPDGPAAVAVQETLGRVCEPHGEQTQRGSQECRQNSNLLSITYLFFTFVREVCGRKTASFEKDASSGGAAGGDDDTASICFFSPPNCI